MFKRLLLLALFLGLSSAAFAQNALTIGAVNAYANVETISVEANYTGDANANGTAVVEYRKSGTSTWLPAFTPFYDRGTEATYGHQARVSIWVANAVSNQSYDVRVTWTDNVDGITNPGANPAQTTATTWNTSPPIGGSGVIRNVSTSAQLSTALGAMNAGDIVNIDGTGGASFNAFSITRNGTVNAWIYIHCINGATILHNTATQGASITINAAWVILDGCILPSSDYFGITINGNGGQTCTSGCVYVKNNNVQDYSTTCANSTYGNGGTNTNYNDAGIFISTNWVWAENNTINTNHAGVGACFIVQINSGGRDNFEGPGECILWSGQSNLVMDSNVCTGHERDGITQDDDDFDKNIDISRNSVHGPPGQGGQLDDALEAKSGGAVNVRIWSNSVVNDGGIDVGNTCFAVNFSANSNPPSINLGPVYIVRNTCVVSTQNSDGQGVCKCQVEGSPGNSSIAFVYFIHNSINAYTGPPYDEWSLTGAVGYNNINRATGSFYNFPNFNLGAYDGSLYDTSVQVNSFAFMTTPSTPMSFADLQALGKEANGRAAAAGYTSNTNLTPANGSAAIDHGVNLNNFNDATSMWPFAGLAPDIGAIETGIPTPPPPPPSGPPPATMWVVFSCGWMLLFLLLNQAERIKEVVTNVMGRILHADFFRRCLHLHVQTGRR